MVIRGLNSMGKCIWVLCIMSIEWVLVNGREIASRTVGNFAPKLTFLFLFMACRTFGHVTSS